MGDGRKFDSDKVDLTLLPASFLRGTAEVLQFGASKYDRFNYLDLPGAGQRYAAALLRHITSWMGGEDHDPETGLHHLAHASANLAILLSLEHHGRDIGSWREGESAKPAQATRQSGCKTTDDIIRLISGDRGTV